VACYGEREQSRGLRLDPAARRGGLAVDLDLAPFHVFRDKDQRQDAIGHATVWLLGLAVLVAGSRQLRVTQNRVRILSRAVEQSPVSVLITDKKGHIQYVNPHFTNLTGYTQEEVLGATPSIMKSGVHPGEYYKGMWKALIAGI